MHFFLCYAPPCTFGASARSGRKDALLAPCTKDVPRMHFLCTFFTPLAPSSCTSGARSGRKGERLWRNSKRSGARTRLPLWGLAQVQQEKVQGAWGC